MFYDKFFEYYEKELEAQKAKHKQDLQEEKAAYDKAVADIDAKSAETKEALKKDYAEKVAALTAAMTKAKDDIAKASDEKAAAFQQSEKETVDSEIARLTEVYEQKVAEINARHAADMEAMKKAYAERIAKTKAEYEEYKKGVATREEFNETRTNLDEFTEKLKTSVVNKVKSQDSKIAKVEETLAASDAKKMSNKLGDIEDVIDRMVNPVIPLIIAILAFLIAAGLCVLMALDLNPFKKPEEPVAEEVTVEETVDPCKDGHTQVLVREVLPYKSETGEQMSGERVYICSVCKEVVVEEIPAHVHNFTGAETTAPTLTAEGVCTYTCDGCEDTYTEAIPALLSGMTLGEDSTHPCKDALLSLLPNAIALDPATVNTAISAEYPFNPDTMMWFITETGDGILVISPAAALDKAETASAETTTESTNEDTTEDAKDAEQLMEEETAKLDNLAGVSGKYLVKGEYILVQVDGLEPFASLKSRMVSIDMIPVQLEDFEEGKNKAKAIGNAIPVPEENATEEKAQTEAPADANS